MRAIPAYVGALTEAALVREMLGIERTDDDQEAVLQFLVNAASTDIEGFTGRRLKSRAYTGTTALRIRSDGSVRIVSPEYPVTAVTAIKWKNRVDGSLAALDLTGMDFDGNWIQTPGDAAPVHAQILLECTAGYDKDLHMSETTRLEAACLRLVNIKWQDKEKHVGRAMEAQLPTGHISYTPTKLPPDFEQELWWARRI